MTLVKKLFISASSGYICTFFRFVLAVTLIQIILLANPFYAVSSSISLKYGEPFDANSADLSATGKISPPEKGCGHVKGSISYKGKAENLTVYLIPLESPPGTPWPKVRTDSKGLWLALNVMPGKYYAMVFDTPPQPAFPSGVSVGFDVDAVSLFKQVEAGKVNDFGREDRN